MKRLFVISALALGLVGQTFAEEGERIDASDLDRLRSQAGMQTTVVGHVTSVGTTQDGGITFINVGMQKKQGFVGVIFQNNYSAFPNGFDQYRNAHVAISGVVELFRGEQPQIKIVSPDQIKVIENE